MASSSQDNITSIITGILMNIVYDKPDEHGYAMFEWQALQVYDFFWLSHPERL